MLYSQDKSLSVSGFINDEISGESLIGTSLLVYKDSLNLNLQPVLGTSSNNFGYYRLPGLKFAKYYLVIRHTGYKTLIKELELTPLTTTLSQNFLLKPESYQLEEIIVEGKKIEKNAHSEIDISPELLLKLPSFSGEVDLFRTLQMLPGINKGSELSNGLYIRGGSPDQTLTLVDGAIVYNPSHIGNIASTFNSNAIRDVKLIKGAFPSEYGGRLGGVLDIKLKSGTKEREKQTIGLGLINSFFSIEGPVKESSSYMISGRWMYYDALQKKFFNNSSIPLYHFYDMNGKINHNISGSSILSLSTMYSYDKMYNPASDDLAYDIEWKNFNLTLNWYKISSNSLFLNSTLSYINYQFSSKIGIGGSSTNNSSYYSNPDLTSIIFKQEADVNLGINHKLKSGIEVASHNYNLVYNKYYDEQFENNPYTGKELNSFEGVLYFQDETELFESFKTNIGSWIYYFVERDLLAFEPRISLSYKILDEFYLKAAYAIANQNIHLIVRNDIALPTDLWYPATKKIKPGRSSQYVFSIDKYFDKDIYQSTIELYYRNMGNLYEFKNSPEINSLNNSIEEQFVNGEGDAYGIELFFQKRSGNFKGWFGYTLSWTHRKFDDLNNGKVFYPKYDRRNDLSIVSSYDLSDQLVVGATFTYATGLRYTLPPTQFIFDPIGMSGSTNIYLNYGEINVSKFPSYHKLDLNLNYNVKLNKTVFDFYLNLHNIYNRKNAFAQFVASTTDNDGNKKTQVKRISLFPFIPSFGVSVTF